MGLLGMDTALAMRKSERFEFVTLHKILNTLLLGQAELNR